MIGKTMSSLRGGSNIFAPVYKIFRVPDLLVTKLSRALKLSDGEP